ncbi:hypothetical protein RHSA111115_01760 [Rheinheimera salexigens]
MFQLNASNQPGQNNPSKDHDQKDKQRDQHSPQKPKNPSR